MNSFKKLFSILLLSFVFAFSSYSTEPIGYINVDYIIKNSDIGKKTLEKINSELAFAPIENSIKVYQSLIETRWMRPKIINYFKENKHLFENEHNQIESFKRKDGESLMETIFRIINERWGFSKENVTTISPNIVFLAIFHFTFIYVWIALIDKTNFTEDSNIIS